MLVCAPGDMNNKRKAAIYPLEDFPAAKQKRLEGDFTYTGKVKKPSNGVPDNIRRVASLNAEVALSLMMSESCESISPPVSPTEAYVNMCSDVGENFTLEVLPEESKSTPQQERTLTSVVVAPSHDVADVSKEEGEMMLLQLSDSSDGSPAHSTSSSDVELEDTAPSSSTKSHLPKEVCVLKKARVDIIDCKRSTANSKRVGLKQSNFYHNPISDGYVRRLASLNARALVAAYLEPERAFKPRLNSPSIHQNVTPSLSPEGPSSPTEAPAVVVSDGVDSRNSSDVESEGMAISRLIPPVSEGYAGVISSSRDFSVVLKLLSSQKHGAEELEDLHTVGYNTIGLLYNGSTVYPHSNVFLNSEGGLPSRIFPVVLPAKEDALSLNISRAREQQRQLTQRPRAVKGDNGWITIGDAIKTITFTKGSASVTRKYYIGIKRRREEVFVRDCILVKAGRRKADKPFVAKVASIWKETGNIMMTLFWYYRPEECEGLAITDNQERELLASQHYDDNSVACVEERCYVLGFRQYSRYCSKQRILHDGYDGADDETEPLVPRAPYTQYHPSYSTDSSLVFLCYRGYNHKAGKMCK